MLREKLKTLKKNYEEVTDSINLLKANGDLSKLCNLRTTFDETFDRFFDSEEIAKKYDDWNEEEGYRACDKSNMDIEILLDDEDLQKLIEFYENYIGELEDEKEELENK